MRPPPLPTLDPEALLRRLAGASAAHLAVHVAGRGVTLLALIVLARRLGAEGFGLIGLALTIQTLAVRVGDLGLSRSLLRIVPRVPPGRRDSALGDALRWAVGVSLPLAAAIWLAAPALDGAFQEGGAFEPVLRVSAMAVPILVTAGVLVSFTRGAGAIAPQLVRLATEPLVLLAGFAVAATAVEAAFANIAVGVAGVLIGAWGAARVLRPTALARDVASEVGGAPGRDVSGAVIFGVSLPMLGIGLSAALMEWTDVLLLGHFRSAEDVGVYTAAARLALVIPMLLAAANMMLAPLISDLYHRDRLPELRTLYGRISDGLLLTALPLVGALFVLATPALLLFGEGFHRATPALRILVLGQLVNVGVGTAGMTLSMTRHQWLLLGTAAGAAMANVALNLLLIPRYGLTGAAVATATSVASANLVRLAAAHWLLGVRSFSPGAALPAAAAVLGASALGAWLGRGIDGPPLLQLVLAGGVIALAYGGGLLLFRATVRSRGR